MAQHGRLPIGRYIFQDLEILLEILQYDLQDTLDKLMHFLPQLSDFVPLKNGLYSFRAQTD